MTQNNNNQMITATQSHAFQVRYAVLYGIECAILLNHIEYWISYNAKMQRNFHDGRTWMYQTLDEIASWYPYLSREQVHRNIRKLVDADVLLVGNYNKSKFDKTSWYAFKYESVIPENSKKDFDIAVLQHRDCEIAIPALKNRNTGVKESQYRDCETATPIPYTKTNDKADIENNYNNNACARASKEKIPMADDVVDVVSLSLSNFVIEEKTAVPEKPNLTGLINGAVQRPNYYQSMSEEEKKHMEDEGRKKKLLQKYGLTEQLISQLIEYPYEQIENACLVYEKAKTTQEIRNTSGYLLMAIKKKWVPTFEKNPESEKLNLADKIKRKAKEAVEKIKMKAGYRIDIADNAVFLVQPNSSTSLGYRDEESLNILEWFVKQYALNCV